MTLTDETETTRRALLAKINSEAAAKSLEVAKARERQAPLVRVRVLLVCMGVLLQRVWSGWPWCLEGPSLVRGQNRLSQGCIKLAAPGDRVPERRL
jgi:hypothetical protein